MSSDDLQVLAPFADMLGPQEGKSRYILGESLGRGSFGRVWHVIRRSDQMHFVAKLIELHRMDANAALRARSEVGCLAACSHFACVGFIEDHNIQSNLLIIMEYCDAGDLHYQLKTMRTANGGVPKGFRERDARLILVQIVLALNHMHRRKMLHRDIKAANVLLSTAGLVKIGDFGLSREYQTTIDSNIAQTFCGTADYLAPEVWKREKYGARADVWSLGILAYECLVGRRPFVGDNLRDKILNEDIQLPTDISDDLRDIMTGMLQKDPLKRISIRELLQSRCLTEALASFADTVSRTRRLSEDQRAFVQAGIEEAFSAASPTSVSPSMFANPSFEGPVAKLKEGRFIDRYLILRDGFIGIFRDRQSCENVTLKPQNARPVQYIVQVTRVPVTRGSNVFDNVFMIDFGGDGDQSNCVWLRSEHCDEWITNLRNAMRM